MQYFEVLAGTLLALAGGTLIRTASRALSLHTAAMSWPAVPGVVTRSELSERTDGDGTSYRAELTCSYSTGGHRYTTSRHTEGRTFSQPEQSARALVSAFPVGKAVEIRIDPLNASGGVLVTGKPVHMVVVHRVGVAALVAGICLGIYGLLRGA
jgi:hypothetical protein